ncbi:MAG: HAD-IB family hydrolase [Desulfobulbus sp.]|nr:MAG: HAD-IB family hydrolase [Desulfobulbus sp.]
MTLAIFDLDNTLLSGDSDYGWGEFLVRKNIVDKHHYEAENLRFYELYKQGNLDIYEYSAFSFEPLTRFSMNDLQQLHEEFMDEVVRPMMGDKAKKLVQWHKDQGHTLLVITATNSFITRPIVKAFGIEHLLATDPKVVEGRFTTEIDGIPCFQDGKVKRLKKWLAANNESLTGSFFYSDSFNDLPLMEIVDHVIAVDPDEKLAEISARQGWTTLSLRDEE